MKHIVYRYIDNMDGIVKYVGITSRTLAQRVNEHLNNDDWVKTTKGWHIDYFYVDTKSQSEAWESHLIALYETYKWYNKAKSSWGIIKEFAKITPQWVMYADNEDIIDIDLNKYQSIEDTSNLITDYVICYECDISKVILYKLIARKIIQPLAKTKSNALLFWETDLEKVYDYIKSNNIN